MSGRSSLPPCQARGAGPIIIHAGQTQYELIRSLGQGHHGELLLARQRYAEGTGGYAVLKRLNPISREEDLHRLYEEARLVSQLRHPNIVSIQLLTGTLADPCLVMDYVEGDRLRELMSLAARVGRPLSEAFACFVCAEIADALHHANTALDEETGKPLEVIHRDVQPHGILVGRHGEVKLLDFGASFSRLPGRISSEGDRDLGTLAYRAPERARMDSIQDGRSDLFSLGQVLYQLLTGRHLLGAEARFEAELRSRAVRVRGKEPDLGHLPGMEELLSGPSTAFRHRLGQLSPRFVEEATHALPEGLRPLLCRALAPQPAERIGSGEELSRALRDHLRRAWPHYGRREMMAEVSALLAVSRRLIMGAPEASTQEGRALAPGRQNGPGGGS
jgi:eukaryotic-like serine/threonine-protein kinase